MIKSILLSFLVLGLAQPLWSNELDHEERVNSTEVLPFSGTMVIRVNNITGEIEYLKLNEEADLQELEELISDNVADFATVEESDSEELDTDTGTSSSYLSFGNDRRGYRRGYGGGYGRGYRGGYRYGGSYGRRHRGSYYYGGRNYRPYNSYNYGGYGYNYYNSAYSE